VKSQATTVTAYLNSLPADRSDQITIVRKVILDHLPQGYEEAMNWGMITYQVPLAIYPDTYNKKPLMYAALASQKNHMAVYLTGIYMFEDQAESFQAAYKATGKHLDMGKSCVRFRKLEDLPLDLIGRTIASLPLDKFIEAVKHFDRQRKSGKES